MRFLFLARIFDDPVDSCALSLCRKSVRERRVVRSCVFATASGLRRCLVAFRLF